jgi:hypothetical protein
LLPTCYIVIFIHVYRLLLLDKHTFCAFLSNKNPHTVRQRQIGVGIDYKGTKNSARSLYNCFLSFLHCLICSLLFCIDQKSNQKNLVCRRPLFCANHLQFFKYFDELFFGNGFNNEVGNKTYTFCLGNIKW